MKINLSRIYLYLYIIVFLAKMREDCIKHYKKKYNDNTMHILFCEEYSKNNV